MNISILILGKINCNNKIYMIVFGSVVSGQDAVKETLWDGYFNNLPSNIWNA